MKAEKSLIGNRYAKSPLNSQSPQFYTTQGRTTKISQTLRIRKSNCRSINPEEAAEVVKNYIIPMFNQEFRSRSRQHRHEQHGVSFDLSRSKGVITEELLLSSKLYERLKKSEKTNQELSLVVEEIKQKNNQNLEDTKYLDLYHKSEVNVKALLFENLELNKQLTNSKLSQSLLLDEKNTYKKLYEENLKELSVVRQALSQEQGKIDIRYFKCIFFNYTKQVQISNC